MSENVQVHLRSGSDTSGFEKFEAAYNRAQASNKSFAASNDLLVNSERRVRSNLSDLVSDLGRSKDVADVARTSLNRLSEVFNVGFAGAVIGGVGAAIIGLVSQANQEFRTIGDQMDKLIDRAHKLKEEIEGVILTPKEKHQRDIDSQAAELEAARDKLAHPGAAAVFGTALGLVGWFLTGGLIQNPGDAIRKAFAENDKARQAIQEEQNALGARAPGVLNFGTGKPRGVGTIEFERAVEHEDFVKAMAEKNDKEKKAKDEAAAKAAKEKERLDAHAAKEEAKEEKSDIHREHASNIRFHVSAGSSRQQGGGGGVFGGVIRDPVVEETRKTNSQLAQSNQWLGSIYSTLTAKGAASPALT